MIRHKPTSAFNKKRKRFNQAKAVIAVAIFVALLLSAHYVAAGAFLVLVYLSHELLWSDHVFYDPRADYEHQLLADQVVKVTIQNGVITLPDDVAQCNSCFLQVGLKADWLGFFFDPFVAVAPAPFDAPGKLHQRQYFERRLSGRRYLNLSHAIGPDSRQVHLSSRYCRLAADAVLYCGRAVAIEDQKILVISPHADDAELAAFGLYRQRNSFILTITAGETDADYYLPLVRGASDDNVAAARIKGRLRAWDSIAIPLWGGVPQHQTHQLGYFCLTLQQMSQQPDSTIPSHAADLTQPEYFRGFNALQTTPSRYPPSSWRALVDDIGRMIEQVKPDIIVMPHPALDPHSDHRYASKAVFEACALAPVAPDTFLLYANHYYHTDRFPFGPANTLATLPPDFDKRPPVRIMSLPLTVEAQQDKLMALFMQHDLLIPFKLKKKLRYLLQAWFIKRPRNRYGDDEYFRKAIRANEIFYQVDRAQLANLVAEL